MRIYPFLGVNLLMHVFLVLFISYTRELVSYMSKYVFALCGVQSAWLLKPAEQTSQWS